MIIVQLVNKRKYNLKGALLRNNLIIKLLFGIPLLSVFFYSYLPLWVVSITRKYIQTFR